MAEQFGDKRHEATTHRREQAREQGQVVRSPDLASAVVLLTALFALLYLGQDLAAYLTDLLRRSLATPPPLADRHYSVQTWYAVVGGLGRCLLPVLGLFLLASFVAHVGQFGWLYLPQQVAFDSNRINPFTGFSRVFSLAAFVRTGFGLVKFVLVSVVAVWALWDQRGLLLGLSSRDLPEIAAFLVEVALWTSLKIGMALLILALLDYGFQRWRYEQDLRMTDQELREELKSTQGDPHIAARRKAVQRQLAQNRLKSTVPKADFVVTNPTELAIAVQYDMATMPAPIVVAKGAGVLAQRIRRLALESGIPIIERKELARALYKQVDVGKTIPAEQYAAVAEILRYVYQLQGRPLPKVAA